MMKALLLGTTISVKFPESEVDPVGLFDSQEYIIERNEG